MKALLGSGGLGTPERLKIWQDAADSFLSEIDEILFIPFAVKDWDKATQSYVDYGLTVNRKLTGIHTFKNPKEAVEKAQAVFVAGGNSFRLLHDLYKLDLISVVHQRAASGMPYLGISAGSNMACPTMMTTNDMPIIHPPSLNAFNLVPFQINPHYIPGRSFWKQESGDMVEHRGETREDRIREFHELNDTPVVGLREGSVLQFNRNELTLFGGAPAAYFEKGASVRDVSSGEELTKLLIH